MTSRLAGAAPLPLLKFLGVIGWLNAGQRMRVTTLRDVETGGVPAYMSDAIKIHGTDLTNHLQSAMARQKRPNCKGTEAYEVYDEDER